MSGRRRTIDLLLGRTGAELETGKSKNGGEDMGAFAVVWCGDAGDAVGTCR
jgi:hypothetical protein